MKKLILAYRWRASAEGRSRRRKRPDGGAAEKSSRNGRGAAETMEARHRRAASERVQPYCRRPAERSKRMIRIYEMGETVLFFGNSEWKVQ